METIEIFPLTQTAIEDLLNARAGADPDRRRKNRRQIERWPFPGTIELWVPDEDGVEQYSLATSLNLSLEGVGVRCDDPLDIGMELAIAIHEPELSFHGRAVVRHCTEMAGDYLIGMQFVFEKG